LLGEDKDKALRISLHASSVF